LNTLAVAAPSFIHAFQDSDSTIITVSRDAAGQRLLRSVPAEHVVFMLSEEVDAAFERTLRNTQLVKGIKREGRFVRVSFRTHDARDRFCFNYASPVKQLGLKTFEGDVSPVLRYVLENKVKIARPRRVYLDIETDSRVPFSRKGDMRVLAWCLVDEDGAAHMGVLEEDTDRSERDLLVRLWEALNQFDQVLAWNGDNFDFPVLAERSSRRGIQVDPRHWLWLDHLVLFAKMNKNAAESAEEKQSMRLNDIAQALVGEGKEETPPEVAAIFGNKSIGALAWDLWEAGEEMRQLLARYNWRDTDLLRRIEEESGYVSLFDTLCDVCHVFGDTNGLNPTKQVDGFMLELGMEADYKFPSQTYRETIDKFKGAFVMEPEGVGIQRNVHVCDFASLYPSIILTWNMSPETLHRGAGKKPSVEDGYALSPLTGFLFSQDTKGILVRALETALEMRKYWTALKASLPPGTPEWVSADRMATAYKVFANSFYGVVGSPFSRFFERAIAESVTQCGVWLAKGTAEEARKWGFTVIYMDTDSVFVKGCTREDFERFTAFCNTTLYPAMLDVVGCRENKIKLAYEKEFERIIFCAGKKYCNPPEAPIWMADMTFKPLGEIEVGDEIVGWADTKQMSTPKKRRLVTTKVVAVHRHRAPIVKVTFASGRTLRCTADHRWMHANRAVRSGSEFITPKVGRQLAHVVDVPKELSSDEKLAAAWLGGMFDGEGSMSGKSRGQIVISQSERANPEVCSRLESTFALLGIDYGKWSQKQGECIVYAIRGGKQARLNFANWCKPAKWKKIAKAILGHRFAAADRIVKIEPDGVGTVIGLTTKTGNYVAWGFASKNCGSYKHYKGTDATANSKPEIKGIEYKRGDSSLLARDLQAEVIDMLVGGLKVAPVDVPTEDIALYQASIERARQRVLEAPLTLEQVRVSKSVNKELNDYKQGVKLDGTLKAQPPHVMLAKMMKARGQEVSEGTRVEYVMVDELAKGTARFVLAEDFDGTVDRFYLWEKLVFPPTLRLLSKAFPDVDWSKWKKVRPPKPKAPRKSRQKPGLLSAPAAALSALDEEEDDDEEA
jgi:DNA polymerase elongation subunit (family B)